LNEYLGRKHKPQAGPDPLIADVLILYTKERVASVRSRSYLHSIEKLGDWWDDKRVSDISESTCREYAKGRGRFAARLHLEVLRAALRYWHRSKHGPLAVIPHIWLPPKAEPRDRWLTRNELARLLWAARRNPYLRRFILLGIYTGSRSSVIRDLQWSWVDLERGHMRRRERGEAEHAKKRRPPVRIGKRLLAHLRRWKRIDGSTYRYIVHREDGARIVGIYYAWNIARDAAGLDSDVIPHSLRHTRATTLMQKGIDVWQAAGHLGMSPATLQRVYSHHSPDWQEDAADA
jgi:integrase